MFRRACLPWSYLINKPQLRFQNLKYVSKQDERAAFNSPIAGALDYGCESLKKLKNINCGPVDGFGEMNIADKCDHRLDNPSSLTVRPEFRGIIYFISYSFPSANDLLLLQTCADSLL